MEVQTCKHIVMQCDLHKQSTRPCNIIINSFVHFLADNPSAFSFDNGWPSLTARPRKGQTRSHSSPNPRFLFPYSFSYFSFPCTIVSHIQVDLLYLPRPAYEPRVINCWFLKKKKKRKERLCWLVKLCVSSHLPTSQCRFGGPINSHHQWSMASLPMMTSQLGWKGQE